MTCVAVRTGAPATTAEAVPHLAPIDGLRALAVVSVVLYHLDPRFLPGGFIGVDIFFVISGFVVSLSLPRAGLGGMRGLLALFYARRAARILPALYACLLVSSLAAALFIPESWLSHINERTGLAAVRGYSNFVLAHGEGDYFGPRADYNMFTHTWSLGVEEQFYLVFPWLFWPWLAGRPSISAALFALFGLLSLGSAVLIGRSDEVAAFYLIFSRFWELALGALAFQASSRWSQPRSGRASVWAAWLCIAAILYTLVASVPDRTPFPDSLLPCGATMLLLILIRLRAEGSASHRLLTFPAATYVGRISYSLYLWHWPIFVLFRWTLGLQGVLQGALAVSLACAAAMLSFRHIEAPPRRWLAVGRTSPGRALALAALLVVTVYPLEKSLWSLRSVLPVSVVAQHRHDWYPDADTTLRNPAGCEVRPAQAGVAGVHALEFRRSGCAAPATRAPALFILGDSHAGAYADLLAAYVLQTGSPGMLYYEGGCAVMGLRPGDAPRCAAFVAAATDDAATRIRQGDVVLLPGLRIARIVEQDRYFGQPQAQATMRSPAQMDWRRESRIAVLPVLAKLVATGARVVLEAPKPVFQAPGFRCADWFNRMNPICAGGSTIARGIIEQLRAPVMEQFRQVTNALPAVHVWDPLPVLCPGDICSAYEGTRPLFFDGDHLSGYGNRKLQASFAAFLQQ